MQPQARCPSGSINFKAILGKAKWTRPFLTGLAKRSLTAGSRRSHVLPLLLLYLASIRALVVTYQPHVRPRRLGRYQLRDTLKLLLHKSLSFVRGISKFPSSPAPAEETRLDLHSSFS
ncbi:hypothetical protein PMIN06_006122 [Paraphaeosphaeria minitans]